MRYSQYGDLSDSSANSTSPIIHSFIVKNDNHSNNDDDRSTSWSTTTMMDHRLDLGVGAEGIIDRMVTVVRDRRRIGEGVVGRN